MNLVAQLARLQLKDADDLDSFFIRGRELLTRLQEAGEVVSETLFNALDLNGLPMRYEGFVKQESFNPATNVTELRKRQQNFHESTAPRHKGQMDCRSKETAQCSKCGEKCHLDRECKRQRDGGKQESVAMGPTLASPDEEYWAALTQWKTAGMLVDSGCTDHIVTNIDAFLDFVPIQSVGNSTQTKGNSNANSKIFCVCRTILQTSYQSQDARSGDMASRSRKETSA